MWFVALVAVVDYSRLSFIREMTNVVDIEYLLFYFIHEICVLYLLKKNIVCFINIIPIESLSRVSHISC